MDEAFDYIVPAEQAGIRLDQLLTQIEDLKFSRSQIQKLIDEGLIKLNKRLVKPSYKVKTHDQIVVTFPPPKGLTVEPEKIPLEFLYQDEDIVVVNKPKGLVTHPAPGNYTGTLVNALLYHCDHLASLGAPLRPGIVHRLDKDTSGVMVVAKNDAAYSSLVKQIKNRTVEKSYIALVHGTIKGNTGAIEARIGRHPVQRQKMAVLAEVAGQTSKKSRDALSYYKVVERFNKYTLVEVKIKTGRTHQIRVHLSYLGHPIVGDQTYGKKSEEWPVKGQLLHAQKLAFCHPRSGEWVEFKTEMPSEITGIIKKLRKA